MLRFSSTKASEGERHAIMSEYEFPPKLDFSKEVNLESLYGMWLARDIFFLLPSARLVITCLRVNNDLFISMASLAARPDAPV